MLQIQIKKTELFDESTSTFHLINAQTLVLEHSLVSIAKWESKWKKPFLSDDKKSNAEMLDYIRCMTLTQNVNPLVYSSLTPEHFKKISDYINDPMTATWFSENKQPKGRSREVVTSELIYYWMIALNIPMECQKWHLNRLLTLIRICNIKNEPPKKMSKRDLMSRNAALNASRRASLHTRG